GIDDVVAAAEIRVRVHALVAVRARQYAPQLRQVERVGAFVVGVVQGSAFGDERAKDLGVDQKTAAAAAIVNRFSFNASGNQRDSTKGANRADVVPNDGDGVAGFIGAMRVAAIRAAEAGRLEDGTAIGTVH